ncbi:sensor histidine kinase [Pararobbsia alpina]|uniref:histidine kinase n=1 Tax=Pararobbsia alpina TaxID=621374 RepID=A0A6S7AW68_9BURK|nr:PAS domain-containing sensor histidine kinase [Pararobbsia alpina]CAB3779055.1 Adaptive-response sensory-kinase SasA [Pararobbsia alpina]
MASSNASLKSFLIRLLLTTVAVTALLLLVLLALASANTEFFDRYYSWLYTANFAIALVFLLIVGGMVWIIAARFRQGRFGTRLLAKLAIFFALVGVLPGGIIYLVSLQFVSRSIESWFDVNVETALESGLNLGRGMLDNALSDLQNRARSMADQLAADDDKSTLTLLRLRDQFGVHDATIIGPNGRVIAQASSNFAALLPDDLPTPLMLQQARGRGYAAVEGEPDVDPTLNANLSAKKPPPKNNALELRVIVRIPSGLGASLQNDERFLQVTQPVQPTLAQNAEAVQQAYRDYSEKALGRTGLRKMYIGTLTLALFLATFIAILLALALGNQLARPLFLLAEGTKEVARGDYTPKREIKSNDELGFLTQSFNAMTRQLSEARIAVERNRAALEQSKSYLESILANLTAGVFVFDRQFRLTTANAGAERIFRQPFQAELNQPLDTIPVLRELGMMVRKAFADSHATAGPEMGGRRGHWQQQLEVPVPGEADPLTLLVRGAPLLRATVGQAGVQTSGQGSANTGGMPSGQKGGHEDVAATDGYVIVFDDISDVISAQRSVAWGEVARRLAHEIKNPLTPIQLSAERLQMKLTDKLAAPDAEVLKRGATTIINQVAAMKRMVDDFREYARTPPAVLQNLQLNDLVAEVLTLYGIDDGKGPLKIELMPLPIIRGDATQLRQVIHNLLQNALDAVADNPAPRVLLETRTVEYGDPDAEGHSRQSVRLSVSDNGSGFPARILTRAFEPYVTTKAKGTGLGLATVKKIVDEHGARIDIRNRTKAGDGSVAGAQVSILFLELADDAATPQTKATAQSKVE